jgi:hypothetical protein
MSFVNTCATQIRAVRERLAALNISHRDPNRFHEEKSEILKALNDVADLLEGRFQLEGDPPPKKRRSNKFVAGEITVDGRVINAVHRFRPKKA